MREQEVVLEDQANVPALGWYTQSRGRILQHFVVQGDRAGGERLKAGEPAKHGGLARTIGAEERHDLAGPDVQVYVETESRAVDAHLRLQAHALGTHRLRSAARTATDTTRSSRLSTIAASGLVSSAP